MSGQEQRRMRGQDFAGGVWHGAFLAAGQALADPSAVLPALIDILTGSSVWVGGLTSLMAAAGAAPQVVVARFVEPLPRKRSVLLAAVYIRAAAWGLLGVALAVAGPDHPGLVLTSLFVLLALFALAGALGGVPYVDLVGKVIPRPRRGLFFASRQAAGSVLGLGASALAGVLLGLSYPMSYASLFLASSALLLVASLGVWAMEEPTADAKPREPWGPWWASLKQPLRELMPLATATWLTGATMLSLPMYVVAARDLGAPDRALAWFIGANVVGALAANALWAPLVDRLGARRMIQVCVSAAILAPTLALASLWVGWPLLVGVMALAGATRAGRRVGFSSALLEEAPAERRATYGATYALLGLPVTLLPLLGGLLASWTSWAVLFGLTAALLGIALAVVSRWAASSPPLNESS